MTALPNVAARRQAIRDAAPCVGCGATRAFCESQRGKDPDAPEWFGCCARGIAMVPCHHVADAGALSELLDEIESGTVRTVEEATPKPRERGMPWSRYLDQGEQWKPNGKPMIRITEMDLPWRYNASRWLERNAAGIARKYTLSEGFEFAAICASPLGPSDDTAWSIEAEMDCAAEDRARDPQAWIRTTALYQALIKDLPKKQRKLARLAERAAHWSTCPKRTGGDGTCTCHGTECAIRNGNPELGCTCRDTSPERTL